MTLTLEKAMITQAVIPIKDENISKNNNPFRDAKLPFTEKNRLKTAVVLDVVQQSLTKTNVSV